MTISQSDVNSLESRINSQLIQYRTEFTMSVHFSTDRLNDPRNNPPITIVELDAIFTRLIEDHILAIVALNDKDTFNIRCTNSHINMPCSVSKTTSKNGSISQKNYVITIMRKEKFAAKDPIEFKV